MQNITEVPLAQLHPHEKNPRIDAAQVEDLCWSVHEHGIEVPLVVVPRPGDEGGYTVIAGHRRMTAAITAELTTVPVQIREDLAEEHAQLTFMATENLMRDQLTVVEEARLVQDLLDLGLSQAEIAKQTALGKKRVSERVKLGKLREETGEKVHRGQISIEDALAIAEYSDDPEAVEELEDAAGGYSFDWALSRAKSRRETREAVKAGEKAIKKAGGRLAAEGSDFIALADLLAEDRFTTPALDKAAVDEVSGEEWDALVLAEHAGCPGHCATANRSGVEWGCDRAEEQHPDSADHDADEQDAPAPDPFARFTEEDLAAMGTYRAKKIQEALFTKDLTGHVRGTLTDGIVRMATSEETWEKNLRNGTRALLGLAADATEPQIRKALAAYPLPVLVLLAPGTHAREQDELTERTSEWRWKSRNSRLVDLMRLLEVEPSDLEKELREAVGVPWTPTADQPDAPTEDEAAEGAETAEVSA